jgi:hypothetical protein
MSYNYIRTINEYLEQKKKKGTTAGGRMSFSNDVLYSYDSVLAIIDKKNNILLIDNSISNISNTSRKHARILLSENMGHEYSVLAIAYINNYRESARILGDNIEHCIQKANRARTMHTKEKWKEKSISKYMMLKLLSNTYLDKRTKEYRLKDKAFKLLFENNMLTVQ